VLTWNRIVAEIASALGVDSPNVLRVPTDRICDVAPRLTGNLKGDKAHPGVFDNAKIKRFVPDFQYRIPFREGVRESVAWLLAHPEQQNLSEDVERMCDDVAAAR
jgi:nucleoside-diphosphate-sugar epimerase